MEETVAVSHPRSVSGWQRVGLPCLFLANAALSLWDDGFHQFKWLPWACMGLSWLIRSERKKEEPLLAFLRKPRNLLTYALITVAIGGFARNLYLLYMKYSS